MHKEKTVNKINRSHTEWEKIFGNDISDNRLTSKLRKWLRQLNINEREKSDLKNTYFSKEDVQRANRYLERCLTSLTRKMQIKTTMISPHICQNGYYQKDKCWQVCGENEHLSTIGGTINWCSHNGKEHRGSSKN